MVTVAVLLWGVLAVRVGANVLMAVDISIRGGSVDLVQFAAVHGIFLCGLCSWSAVRRAAVVQEALAVPMLAALPGGRVQAFVRSCRLRAVAGRPSYGVPVAAAIAASVVAIAFGDNHLAALALVGIFAVCALFPFLVAHLGTVMGVGADGMAGVELIGLLLLLSANPDLAPAGGSVGTVIFYRTITPRPLVIAALTAGWSLLPVVPMLLLRIASLITNRAARRASRRPLMAWYRRLCLVPWIVIAVVMVPITFSGSVAESSRRWVAAVVGGALIGWLVAVIAAIDQTLEYQWNRPIARRRSAGPLLPLVAVHLLITAVVVGPALVR
jgi:hypothetical protein